MNKKKIAFIAISVIVCLLVYLPTPKGVDPEQYQPGHIVNLNDINVPKNKLNNAVLIATPAPGAEDVEVDQNGFVYSGLHDGSIVRIKPDNSELKVIAKSEGPIFGVSLNKQGDKLVVADQKTGIKLLNLKDGSFENLVSEFEGAKFVSPNGVTFGANDEVVYFSVSSKIIPMSQFHEMLLYSEGSGRIFGFNLRTKELELLASNLHFANGVEFDAKENCLYFLETSRSRLSRLELAPEKRGNVSVVLDNIFGYPDNVKMTDKGHLWVAIPALRDSFSNIVDHNSVIRRIILNLRMPLKAFLVLANMKYAGGIKVDPKSGEIVDYFFGDSHKIDCISGMNEANGKLYLSSLSKNKIAIVDLNSISSNKVPNSSQKIVVTKQAASQNAKKIISQKQQMAKQKIEDAKQKIEQAKKQINNKIENAKQQKQQIKLENKQKIVVVDQKVGEKIKQKVETIKDVKQNIKENVQEKIQAAKAKIQQAKAKVKQEEIVEVGKKQGIVETIKQTASNIKQQINQNVQDIVNSVHSSQQVDINKLASEHKQIPLSSQQKVTIKQTTNASPKKVQAEQKSSSGATGTRTANKAGTTGSGPKQGGLGGQRKVSPSPNAGPSKAQQNPPNSRPQNNPNSRNQGYSRNQNRGGRYYGNSNSNNGYRGQQRGGYNNQL